MKLKLATVPVEAPKLNAGFATLPPKLNPPLLLVCDAAGAAPKLNAGSDFFAADAPSPTVLEEAAATAPKLPNEDGGLGALADGGAVLPNFGSAIDEELLPKVDEPNAEGADDEAVTEPNRLFVEATPAATGGDAAPKREEPKVFAAVGVFIEDT